MEKEKLNTGGLLFVKREENQKDIPYGRKIYSITGAMYQEQLVKF